MTAAGRANAPLRRTSRPAIFADGPPGVIDNPLAMALTRRRPKRKRLPTAPSPKRGSLRLAAVLAVLVAVNLYVFLWRGNTSIPAVMEKASMAGREGLGADNAASAGAQAGAGTQGSEGAADPGAAGAEQAGGAAAGADPGTEAGAEAMGEAAGAGEPGAGEVRWIEGEVQSGDSMGRILRREGMTPPEADELIRTLQEHMDLRSIRPGQTYRVRFDAAGRLEMFEFDVSRTTRVRAERDASGKIVGRSDKASTEVRVEEIGGRIESSLYASMKSAGEDPALVSFFVDVFAYDIDFFTETHSGDNFRMLVEKEYLDGAFLRYRRVLAAEYRGKVGNYDAFWWTGPGSDDGRYYNRAGESLEKSLLKTPLKFARISSRFNLKRMHPVLHRQRAHMGVDYAAPTGTPVWAAADGRIVGRGDMGGAGNCVILQHDNGLQTIYMHLSKFERGQSVGQRVKSKTVIGYVGATGLATGPHLHFGVKQRGQYVDPFTLKMARGPGVPRKHRPQFKVETERLAGRLARIPVSSDDRMLVQSGN
jgi:murein DD-endopeptidase MepM/ murein hydrolase activator NlpD